MTERTYKNWQWYPILRRPLTPGFLEGLKGYNPLVLATQFSVQVDLVVKEPIDAQSVEKALLAALATKEFGLIGMAVVAARAVVAPPVESAPESA